MPDAAGDHDLDWHCYKHPDREAGVRCRRCERAICPDCMITAPVGFQCRECVKGAPAVRTMRSLRPDPYLTWALVAVNVVAFLPSFGTTGRGADLGVRAFEVAVLGEWWRIVSAGFLHFNLLHLGFNMLLLWWLGGMLEPALGRLRYGLLYLVSLLAGSLGALALSPDAYTGGASGAVFGLMAAAFLFQRRRNVDPMQGGLGGLLLVNLLLTFARPGISIGGHLGGLVGGAAVAAVLDATEGDRARRALGMLAVLVLGVLVTLGALWVAENPL